MSSVPDGDVSRRSFLRMSMVCISALGGAALGGFGGLSVVNAATAASPNAAGSGALTMDGNPRFLFQPITPVPGQLQLGSLQDVWASPKYATYTDCVVTYVGGGEFVLSTDERAIVDVVANAGGDVSDPQLVYLTVVAVSTRLDPHRLEERLAATGGPIVRGSLALAPFAPQAVLLGDWLATHG